jgi:hypothetical protein
MTWRNGNYTFDSGFGHGRRRRLSIAKSGKDKETD